VIVFSDILLILNASGQKVEFKEKTGPTLENYNLNKFYKTRDKIFIKKLENVYKILKKIKKTLPKEKALIGFAGSPWTLLTYMINRGSPKKNINFLKKLKKKEATKIIKKLEHLVYIHCKEQILAGADTIQLFDSWAGLIKKKNLKEFCINPNKNIVNKIKKNFPNNPVICFPKGINKNINNFIKEVNPHGISIDYDINLKNLNLNNDVVFQGGMNPKFLLGNNKRMFEEAKKYLDFFKNKPYIFNLGHGILPKTKPENVKKLVEFVRSYNL
jgi:uroporphyrinogen decarboxylase